MSKNAYDPRQRRRKEGPIKKKKPCPKFSDEQIARGFICVNGEISIDKKKNKEYRLKKQGGTRKLMSREQFNK